MKIQSTTLWILLWMSDTIPAVIFWPCPRLNVPDAVSCMCDLPHTLRCSGACSRHCDAFRQIASSLRALPDDTSVQALDLSLRNLSSVPDDSFAVVRLHALVIASHEPLRLSPRSFRGLESTLLALGLPHNNLTAIPVGALRTLTLLEKLDFSNNQVARLAAGDLSPWPSLEEANFGYNRISDIEEASFRRNRRIKKLVLDGNRLSGPSFGWSRQVTDGLEALEFLSLQRNRLSGNVTKRSMPHLPSLTKLDVAFNGFGAIHSGAFAELRRMQFLDLSHNLLASIEEGAFEGLKSLMKLDLSHNRLSDLSDKAFQGLSSLAYLYLSDNYLSHIGETVFDQLRSIRLIKVRDNEIAHIHAAAFVTLHQLESLDLEDNNIQCDCKMKGFATWLKTKASLPIEKKRLIVCDSPPGVHHQALIDLQPREFVCSNGTPSESLAKMEEEERGRFVSVSDSGLSLVDYEYAGSENRLTLMWSVDRASQPYQCDAVFLFQQVATVHQMRDKVQVSCDSKTETNPNRVRVQLNDVVLDAGKTYRFCLVLFSLGTLVPGCSEPLRLHSTVSGNELVSVASTPELATSESEVVASYLPTIHVNESTPASVLVSWSFPPSVAVSESCMLNVSVSAGAESLAERHVKCSARGVNWTRPSPPSSYRVCVAVLEPVRLHRDGHCLNVEPHAQTVASASIIATVIGSLLVALGSILLVAIVFLARRMFWPAKKSLHLLAACRDGPQYRVLYHQPEDARTAATTGEQLTQV